MSMGQRSTAIEVAWCPDHGLLGQADVWNHPSAMCWCSAPRERRYVVLVDDPEKITHGRHCTCGAREREDWTNPQLAPCGMHGSACPACYQPLGPAGTRPL